VIFPDPDIFALFKRSAALTDDDAANLNNFSAKEFNTEAAAGCVASVAGTTACFFVCHFLNPSAFNLLRLLL
jgi:hypothetical protein